MTVFQVPVSCTSADHTISPETPERTSRLVGDASQKRLGIFGLLHKLWTFSLVRVAMDAEWHRKCIFGSEPRS
jgi:hypothetical protein